MTPFASAQPDLSALGYTVIPLISPHWTQHQGRGKCPGEYRSGWSGMSKWQRFRDETPSSFQLNVWSKAPDANAGLICGTRAGTAPNGTPLFVVSVDLDATDPDALDTLVRATPASSMVKRGLKGETRIFRAPSTIKTRSYDGPDGRLLDLLTGFDTRQTVVPPSIHPATLQPYVWLAGPVAATDLPILTEEDIEALEEALETCGWDRNGPVAAQQRERRPVPASIDASDPFERVKVAAMANLGAWVGDLPGLYGLRPARGGYEAVDMTRPSSTGRPVQDRKRNLSIQASGIKDFGTNWTGSAIDLVMRLVECSEGEALVWLEDRLGLGAPDVEIALAGSVVRPVSQPIPDDDLPEPLRPRKTAMGVFVDALKPNTSPEPVQIAAKSEHASTELPDHLTRVPGLVGVLTDWIADSARKPQRAGALLAALELVGTAAGRKFAGPTLTGTHLYGLFLAPSGAAKDHPLKCIGRALHAATMGAHFGPGGFMSLSSVISRITRQPLTLSCIDEFGSFLGRINGRKAATHEKAITGILRSAWGSSFDTMAMPEWAGRVGEPVHSPALSIYGVSTHEEFFQNLDGGDVFNGFLNRFLILSTQQRVAEREPTADKMVVPQEAVDGMLAIYTAGNPLIRATSHSAMADAPMIVVPWDDQFAHRAYLALSETCERMEHDAVFFTRTAEMAQRLAVIRAIGIDPARPRVTLEDMDWGVEVAMWSARQTVAMSRDYMAETQHQGEAQRVVRTCKRGVWTPYRDIARALNNRMRAKDLRDMLDGLVDAGSLEVQEERPASGGHKIKSYRLAG